ncbi:MAG TPA: hypothetical protein VL098_08115 [Flavipsychrobacter sp.]|nr:hypothetical protein [Flavipsychrobacter sp.]
MSRNFSTIIHYNRQKLSAVVLPVTLADGMRYEVNIKGFPRFFMAWSALGRYDWVKEELDETVDIPYDLVLAVSDMLDKLKK